MQLILILALLLAILAVFFALQNTAVVTVALLAWNIHGSLALILLVSFCLGVVVSLLASLPSLLRRNRMIANQKQIIKNLEDSIKVEDELLTPSEPIN